jgi:hypothetical protein
MLPAGYMRRPGCLPAQAARAVVGVEQALAPAATWSAQQNKHSRPDLSKARSLDARSLAHPPPHSRVYTNVAAAATHLYVFVHTRMLIRGDRVIAGAANVNGKLIGENKPTHASIQGSEQVGAKSCAFLDLALLNWLDVSCINNFMYFRGVHWNENLPSLRQSKRVNQKHKLKNFFN